MLIPVIYLNGKQDMVKDFYLTDLIERRQISKFKRRDGWVNLSTARIRKASNGHYAGLERRGQLVVEVPLSAGSPLGEGVEDRKQIAVPKVGNS